MIAPKLVLIPLIAGMLSACVSSSEDDLQQWMANERAQTKPRVTPISEPKKFEPQALKRDSSQTGANASLIAPEQIRRKQPLEAYPLDAMAMVGSLTKAGKPTALLKVDNLLYQVQMGDYLGQNYGRVVKITESAIQLREIVQDSTGDWTEKMTSLDLQEGAKK